MVDSYPRVAVDLGTGAGQAVLRRARANVNELVIGIDADAAHMAESSRRAAAPPRKGGLPNVLFLAAAAEELPGPLAERVDHVAIALPWGSLLRGLLSADQQLIAGIVKMLRAGGDVEMLISTTDRDAAARGYVIESETDAARFAATLEGCGLQVVDCRPAVESDVQRLSSSWGKRLGIPRLRPAWLVRGVLRQDRGERPALVP